MDIKETELYAPVKKFLEGEGFFVQAEVKDCDIAAKRGDELVIVELKKGFTLKLIYQAIDRQALTEQVFVAIPRPKRGQNSKDWKNMLRLLKRLELGLLTVALDSPLKTVDIILEPNDSMTRKNRKKRERLERELDNRNVQENTGGMTRKKIMTAYREKAIELCCLIEARDKISLKELRDEGMDAKYASILKSNFYKWFERVEKGVYALSAEGICALDSEDFKAVAEHYRRQIERETDK